MQPQDDLNKKIFLTTLKIQKNFPELTKYFDEIPRNFTFSCKKGVNKKELKEYLDTLNMVLETYAKAH